MNTHFTYFLILGASLFFPLVLSFDKKVAYYTKWKYFFRALIIPFLFYVVWDVWFTQKGIWSFNEIYVTGFNIINLPVEEVLFFIIVPFCCVFIYECIVSWFPSLQPTKISGIIFTAMGALLIITGLINYDKLYTFITFLFCGSGILFIRFYRPLFKYFNTLAFLVSYLIIVIPFTIVNGFLTAIPVVLYNDDENLGMRIYTIPVEDLFYGFLLIAMVVAVYERSMKRDQLTVNNSSHLVV